MKREVEEHTPVPKLRLPIHEATCFVLVRPHYPENVGAAARAIKTQGFTSLLLVKPGRLAAPDHEMALKMAVKSKDVLRLAACVDTLAEAVADRDWVVATTSRRGMRVEQPREMAREAVVRAGRGERIAIVFGNEKTGLSEAELEVCPQKVRIPMAADQPSINLAQATQIIAYELLLAALHARVE